MQDSRTLYYPLRRAITRRCRISSRVAKKERRRAERIAREREHERRERRHRRLRIFGVGALAALGTLSAIALAALVDRPGKELPAGSERAFGQHYAGLERRRERAGVSTMAAPTGNVHIHPRISVWVEGKRVPVPPNIGIDPRRPASRMAGLHTHSDDGRIHDEGMAAARLGQFFAIWGVRFGPQRLGPYRAGRGKVVQLWVDGKPSAAWGSLALADGQRIAVTFGRPRKAPPG